MDKVVFSPDERKAAYVIGDTIRLCDLKTGDELMTFRGHSGRIWGLAFWAGGRRLASVGRDDETIRTWNVKTGQEDRQIKAGHVGSLAVFPDGRRVLAPPWWTIGVWDLETGQQLRRLDGLADGYGCSLAISTDGRRALFGRNDLHDALLWDLETSELLGKLEGHTAGVCGVAFSADGRRAATTSFDKTVRVWALPPGQAHGVQPPMVEVAHFLGHQGRIVSKPAVSPDGSRILSGSSDATIILWDRETAQPLRHFTGHVGDVWAVAFSPDGRRALSGGFDKVVRLWDPESGEMLGQFKGHTDPIFDVAFAPDGRLAYSAGGGYNRHGWQNGRDFAIHLWDLRTGGAAGRFEGHNGFVWCIALSPDGRHLLTGGNDKDVILWNTKTRSLVRRFSGHTERVESVAFLPDGRRAVSGSNDAIRLWELESGQAVHCFRGHRVAATGVAVSPDGRWLLSSDFSGHELLLWDLEARKLIHRYNWGAVSPLRGSFTPDGCHALWGGSDGVMRMYRITGSVQADRPASAAKPGLRNAAAARLPTRTASSTPP